MLSMERSVNILKLSKEKLEIAQAEKMLNAYGLCEAAGIQYQTYYRIIKGFPCKPTTAGRIAAALEVRVEDLIEKEE